jgi:hypothetical protein
MEILELGNQQKNVLSPTDSQSDPNLSRVRSLLHQYSLRHYLVSYANDEILLESFHTKNLLEIMRDIGRTFPTHPFFIPSIGPGEGILARILRASFRFRQDVGYCQVGTFTTRRLIFPRE